jgi:predicted nucleic acid-binding protein
MKLPQKIIDANVILRFLLADEKRLFQKARDFIQKLESGEEEVLLSELIFAEVVWVLHKVYEVPRKEISERFSNLIKFRGIKTLWDKDLFITSLVHYANQPIDIQDIFLTVLSKKMQAQVITFDKTDFRKLGASFSEP